MRTQTAQHTVPDLASGGFRPHARIAPLFPNETVEVV